MPDQHPDKPIKDTLFYFLMKNGLFILFNYIYHLRIYGAYQVPAKGPVLLVSNHQSFLDPILCGVGIWREVDFMARDTLFNNRYFGGLIHRVNAFPINREAADMAGIRLVVNRLKQGRAVLVFPEGTRSRDGRIADFKGGFHLIARRAEAWTVPMVVEGAFEAWPRSNKWPDVGVIIRVKYGRPISPEMAQHLHRDDYIHNIKQQMYQMHNELRRQSGRELFDYPEK